jgi:hypothetical protein
MEYFAAGEALYLNKLTTLSSTTMAKRSMPQRPLQPGPGKKEVSDKEASTT